MKLHPETIFILPDGELTTGEKILRALELEKRILAFAGDEEDG